MWKRLDVIAYWCYQPLNVIRFQVFSFTKNYQIKIQVAKVNLSCSEFSSDWPRSIPAGPHISVNKLQLFWTIDSWNIANFMIHTFTLIKNHSVFYLGPLNFSCAIPVIVIIQFAIFFGLVKRDNLTQLLLYLGSISSTCYMQLFCQRSCTSKLQT